MATNMLNKKKYILDKKNPRSKMQKSILGRKNETTKRRVMDYSLAHGLLTDIKKRKMSFR